MRIVKNSYLLLLSLFFSHFALAEVAQLDRKVSAFVNNTAPESILLISENGQADWLRGLKVEKGQSYKIVDQECTPRTQSTMLMGDSGGGMTLAYPFLVGVERVCHIDEKSKSIHLLANLRPDLPRDAFSAVYAGADESSSYFLINGRPFPDGLSGYLLLVTVNKTTLTVTVRELVTEVPGFSGAMLFSKDAIWVTSWLEKNDIYKISVLKLIELIHSGGSLPFSQLANKELSGIDGMSFFMIGNDLSFLYYNDDFESYSVNRSNGLRANIAPPCMPIAGYKKEWLLLCNGTMVERWKD